MSVGGNGYWNVRKKINNVAVPVCDIQKCNYYEKNYVNDRNAAVFFISF